MCERHSMSKELPMKTLLKPASPFVFWLACVVVLSAGQVPQPQRPSDAIEQAQQRPITSGPARPEQSKTAHDQSGNFDAANAQPASPVTNDQANKGKITGFDFFRDPLNADRPNLKPEEIVRKESANKPNV